jgi:hypothetical protein
VEGVVQCQNQDCECRHRENPLKWTFASQVALGLQTLQLRLDSVKRDPTISHSVFMTFTSTCSLGRAKVGEG